jgi:hypothetical protein
MAIFLRIDFTHRYMMERSRPTKSRKSDWTLVEF